MQLTRQQEEAIMMIKDFVHDEWGQIFILKGYAGTGKTTLIRQMVDYMLNENIQPQVMAPTGRAAKVLSNVLPDNIMPSTIHRRIYQYESGGYIDDEGEFKKLLFPIREDDGRVKMCIVDEASMVSSKKSENELFVFGTDVLIDDLLTYVRPLHGGKIIFVGDPAQLPPVGDNSSMALDESYFQEKGLNVRSYCLTDVVRQQKESCILTNATKLRNLLETKERNTLVFETNEGEVVKMLSSEVVDEFIKVGMEKSAIVCFTNQKANEYNKKIRNILFPNKERLTVGDRLMVVRNSYREDGQILLNGDMLTVLEVAENTINLSAPVYTERNGEKEQVTITNTFRKLRYKTEDGKVSDSYIIDSLLNCEESNLTPDQFKALFINTRMRARDNGIKDRESFEQFKKNDEFYNALQVKYGYSFTCHKAQGTEWATVFVDFHKRTGLDNDCLRWKYTAVTRAKQKLYVINLPEISLTDNIQVKSIGVGRIKPAEKILYSNVRETPYHRPEVEDALKCKYWSVVRNMEEDGNQYSVVDVKSSQYLEKYMVKTCDGQYIKVEANYNKSGLFSRYVYPKGYEMLKKYFEDEFNIDYSWSYEPPFESLGVLHDKMVSLCDELGVSIFALESLNWKVRYYLRTSDCYSYVDFCYDGKGKITFAQPMSEKGVEDEKLKQLISKLNCNICQ